MPEERDRPEPLWATSLAQQSRQEDVTVRVEREEREPLARPVRPRPRPRPKPRPEPARAEPETTAVWPPVVIGVLAAILVVALAASLTDRGSLVVKDVSSFWGNVPMTCHTARFEQDGGAFELFRCHAIGAGRLPPGAYVTPDAQWTSDLTRQEATVNLMQITRGGELRGWAAY